MLGIVFWPSCGGRVESIAVLPFENLSVDEADQYRVSGFMVELVQTLHKSPGISVIPGRVTYANREVSEIGEIFDVDAILFGELQRVGSEIKITYRIVRACNGKVIAAGELGGQVGEEFALQEQMAYQVRSELTGDAEQQLLSQQRHPNSDAYDRYMRGLFLLERRGLPENFDMAIDLFEQAIEIDPAYGAPYLSLASAYVLLYDYANEPLAESIQRALDVIERGIEQDDSIEDAAAEIIGYAHHKQRQWEEAEQSYIRATTGEVVDSNAFNWYSLMLGGVGRLDDALEQILIAQKLDPTSVIINTRLGMIYTWLGENKNAAEYLDRASQLDASWDMLMFGRAILLAREEKLDEAASMFDAGVTLAGGTSDWLGPFFEAVKDSTKVRTAVVAINSAFEDPVMDPRIKIVVLTVLGETDEAMNVAMTLANSDVFFEVDFLFAPELQPLRQHPGFMVLMKELGIVDYWEANQCVWEDDRVHCPS
jgi:TolB-like protein